jgi:hypothetical protein
MVEATEGDLAHVPAGCPRVSRMKNLVLVVALATSLAVALFLLSRSDGPHGSGAAPERSTGPVEVSGPGAAPDGIELEAGVGRPTTRAAAEVAAAPEVVPSSRVAQAGEVLVQVLVVAPPGSPGDEVVEVVATTLDVGAGRVLGALDIERESDALSAVEAQFIEREPEEDRFDVLRSSIVQRVLAERGADGDFHAELALPAGRDFWLLAFGNHLRTPQPTAVPRDHSRPVRLEPELGAALELVLLGADDGAASGAEGRRFELADQRVSVRRDDEGAAFMNPGASDGQRGQRVRQDRRTDQAGRVRVRALPARTDLVLVVWPDVAAPVRRRVPGLAPGETRVIEVALSAGATVSGVVTDPAGAAAPGARVLVLRRGQMFGFDDVVVREGVADEGGRFTVGGLPEGKLIARAEHDLWLQSLPASLEVLGQTSPAALTLALRPGRSIQGFLHRADGGPVTGVEVRARFDAGHLAGPQALGANSGARGRGVADAGGAFVIAGLGAGPFVVEAEAPAPASGDAADAVAPLRARLDGVKPGSNGVVLTLRPPLALAGRVVDEAGAPVGDVEVALLRVTDGALCPFDQARHTTRTDAELGTFRCEGLLAGKYEAIVRTVTHVTLAPVAATLPEDGARDLELVAHRTATARGIVRAPNGGTVADARVHVEESQPEWMRTFQKRGKPIETTAADDGTFELLGIPPGEVSLGAKSSEWARASKVPLTLTSGEVREDVVLVMSNGGSLTGEVFDDEGKPAAGRLVQVQKMDASAQRQASTDAAGTFSVEHVEPGKYQVIAIDVARMGESGQTKSGEGLDVSGMMSAMKMASVDIVDGEVTHVVLGAPPSDPVRVTGNVTRAGAGVDGAIVSFLPAGPNLYERMKIVSTDATGAYSLVLDEPGDYVVAVQRQTGGIGQQSTVEFRAVVPEGEESRHDFELPGGRIAGRVVDGEGRPVAGARVSLTTSGGVRTDQLMGGNSAEIATDGDGRFVLEGLRPGTFRVAAGGASLFGSGGSGGSALGRVTRSGLVLGENEALEGLELRLPAPGSLEVTVRGTDGAPRPGVTVFVRDAEGVPLEAMSFLQTSDQGRVVVEGLAPGRYTVSARGKGEAAGDGAPVTVREGQKAETALTLEAGTVLRIRLDVRGEGEVPPATIRVLDGEGREVTGMLGLEDLQMLYMDGAYSRTEHRLGPVPAGRYTVHASGAGLSGERRLTLRGEAERTLTLTLERQ